MGIITKKTGTFAERLTGIKTVFKQAYDNAFALKEEMAKQISEK